MRGLASAAALLPKRGSLARQNHPAEIATAHALKSYRQRCGLSVQTLAARSGLKPERIEALETRKVSLLVEEFFKIARAFRIPAWKVAKRIQKDTKRLEAETAAGRKAS